MSGGSPYLFTWDGSSNAWNTNHWGRGGVAPQYPGDTGDGLGLSTVIINLVSYQAPPTSGPAAAYSCKYMSINGFTSAACLNSNLTVTAALYLGISNSDTVGILYTGKLGPNCAV